MSAVVFDTLILSRKLAAAGMPTEQAQGVAAAIAETLGEQIATRRDLEDVRRDIADLRREFQRDLHELEQRMDVRFRESDARLVQFEAALRAEIRLSEQRQTIRLGLMLVGAIASVAAMVKLL